MAPTLNPAAYYSSSWLEDDYVLVKRTSEHEDWKTLAGALVLVRDPAVPTETHFLRLAAVEGQWVRTNAGFSFVQAGHCALETDDCSGTKGLQVPLSLIEGKIERVLWPPSRLTQPLSKNAN